MPTIPTTRSGCRRTRTPTPDKSTTPTHENPEATMCANVCTASFKYLKYSHAHSRLPEPYVCTAGRYRCMRTMPTHEDDANTRSTLTCEDTVDVQGQHRRTRTTSMYEDNIDARGQHRRTRTTSTHEDNVDMRTYVYSRTKLACITPAGSHVTGGPKLNLCPCLLNPSSTPMLIPVRLNLMCA